MRNLVLLALALLFLGSCEKEEIVSSDVRSQALDVETYDVDAAKRGKANKVDICHYDKETDTYELIRINRNALDAHLRHGDQIVDADGDGYTAIGSCVGSADDCDDTDPDVNPGAEEICDNGIDDNCDGVEATSEDADGDGYTAIGSCGGSANDCDDTDPDVNPGAEEICDNGIDDDCDGDVDEGCDPIFTITLPNESKIYAPAEDQAGSIPWGTAAIDVSGIPNTPNGNTAAQASTLTDFRGAPNTRAIVSAMGNGSYAAKVCDDLVYAGYDDWYLPAVGELRAMLEELRDKPNSNLANRSYWSSSEFSSSNAGIMFETGVIQLYKLNTAPCRCVRK